MVKVKIESSNEVITRIVISGHAGYDEKGKDLVCAAVSSIAVGTLNALDELTKDDCELILTDDQVMIIVKRNEHDSQMIIKTLIIQIKTLQESYPNYLKIIQTEV